VAGILNDLVLSLEHLFPLLPSLQFRRLSSCSDPRGNVVDWVYQLCISF